MQAAPLYRDEGSGAGHGSNIGFTEGRFTGGGSYPSMHPRILLPISEPRPRLPHYHGKVEQNILALVG